MGPMLPLYLRLGAGPILRMARPAHWVEVVETVRGLKTVVPANGRDHESACAQLVTTDLTLVVLVTGSVTKSGGFPANRALTKQNIAIGGSVVG